MTDGGASQERTWTEVIEVYACDLVERVKGLVKAGNVRRLIIRNPNDHVLLEIPLTAGVAVGSVVTLISPVLAALGAMAALLTKVKIEVIRARSEGEDRT
jgi:hypothetical protein